MSKKPLGESNLFTILGLLFIAVIGLRTISTPKIWTHLAQGRVNEPISWLAADNGVNTTWLYDKLAYLFYGMGGASLLIILNIVGLVAAFALLCQVAKKWGGGLSQGFALLIAGHVIFQTVDVGPATLMALYIGLYLYLLSIIKKPAVLFGALIPLQLLWTNTHGSFLFGPVIVGLAAWQIAQNNKGPAKRKKKQDIPFELMGGLAGALLVATLVNPALFKLHAQAIANVTSPQPAYWSSLFWEYYLIPEFKPLMLFAMVLCAAGLITLKKRLPATLTGLMIIGGFLAFTSWRQHAFLFAVLTFPFLVLSLNATSEQLQSSFSNLMGEKSKLMGPAAAAALVVLLIISIVPVVTNAAYVKTGSASNFGLGAQENLYPDGAEAILNHPAFPAKAINLPADGGYLAFKYERSCFMDYRPGRYDTELIELLAKSLRGDANAYDELALEHRPDAFIINNLRPWAAQGVVTLISRGWKLAYFDGTTSILLRDNPEFAEILNDTATQKAGLAKLEKARAAFAAKNGKSSGGNPAELIGAGKVYLALNRPVEAKSIFALILQSNLKTPGAWIGLSRSQLFLKEFDAAVESGRIAVKQAPSVGLAWSYYADACKYAGLTEEANEALEQLNKIVEKSERELEETEEEPEAPITPKKSSLTDVMITE